MWLFYSLFVAYLLIYAALGVLHLSICKLDVVSVFFNLRVVRKTPAEISPLDLLCIQHRHKKACIRSSVSYLDMLCWGRWWISEEL